MGRIGLDAGSPWGSATFKFLSERECSSTRRAIGPPRGANKSEREKSGGCAPTVTGLFKASDLAAGASSGLGQVPLRGV